MKRLPTLLLNVFCAALLLQNAPTARAQVDAQVDISGLGYSGVIPWQGDPNDALIQSLSATTIPLSSFTFISPKTGGTFTPTIVGRSPFGRGKTSTAVNVVIVPLKITIAATVFDSSVTDPCVASVVSSDLALVQNSPIFNNVVFDGSAAAGHASMINGVNVGTVTYTDALRRGEFWSHLQGTSYHTTYNVTTTAVQTITAAQTAAFGATAYPTGSFVGQTCPLGVVNINNFDPYIRGLITTLGLGPTQFPIFLMKNVVMSSNGTIASGCCILGFHGSFGAPVQTYSPLEFDSEGAFGAGTKDISVLSHEVGEWLNDPLGTNATPPWGGIGQVTGCQGNWEAGDPLSGTLFPGILMSNGFTYHPQELPLFEWFYDGDTPPAVPVVINGVNVVAAGAKFSMNGTFTGPAKACPPGGTNPS